MIPSLRQTQPLCTSTPQPQPLNVHGVLFDIDDPSDRPLLFETHFNCLAYRHLNLTSPTSSSGNFFLVQGQCSGSVRSLDQDF